MSRPKKQITPDVVELEVKSSRFSCLSFNRSMQINELTEENEKLRGRIDEMKFERRYSLDMRIRAQREVLSQMAEDTNAVNQCLDEVCGMIVLWAGRAADKTHSATECLSVILNMPDVTDWEARQARTPLAREPEKEQTNG